jgi:DNA polymerase III subunit alpha
MLALEKESIGFYITAHPLDGYFDVIGKYANANALTVKEDGIRDGQAVRIGGMVKSIKTIITKKGDPMAFLDLEDLQGTIEDRCFSEPVCDCTGPAECRRPIVCAGNGAEKRTECKILADEVVPVDKAEEIWAASLHIHMDADVTDESTCCRSL